MNERLAGRPRLADLLAALSMMSDLGMGYPADEAIRTCLLATSLARRMGLDDHAVSAVYYTTLLQHVGCTAYAHEESLLFGGDEIAARAQVAQRDLVRPRDVLAFLFLDLAANQALPRRAPIVAHALVSAPGAMRDLAASTCEVAAMIARRLGLDEDVQRALRDTRERWDGKGQPRKVAGDDIALPARLAQVAALAVVFHRLAGADAAVAVARQRAGTALDPEAVDAFARYGQEILSEIEAAETFAAALAVEPEPHRLIRHDQLNTVASAFADAVDLKVACTRGHSTRVAELATGAARRLGMAEVDVAALRIAALLHDLGRVAIPNGVWEKPGPLTVSEWEQVRLHPYYTERILARTSALAPLAALASAHHERLDGSGYPRRIESAQLPLAARILAAADSYQAMTQPRPHRPARTPSESADELSADVAAGRHDRQAASAVCDSAGEKLGQTLARPASWPAGLSDREVEVLDLIARGWQNREVARHLDIAPKTVDHHVQHIYAKIEVSTRAAAAMFAMEHGLIRNERR